MGGRARSSLWAEIDPYIEAFETARARGDGVSLSTHLPAPSHPHFITILCELVRVDLEFGWGAGCPRPLAEYFDAFPALATDPLCRAQAAFEEYRLRQQAGESPLPEEYARRFGVDTATWPARAPRAGAEPGSTINNRAEQPVAPTVVSPPAPQITENAVGLEPVQAPGSAAGSIVPALDPAIADRLAQVLSVLQQAPTEFLGFRVLRELGRGAFGRVYLARQGDLADRDVVLKLSGDLRGEPQTLARLQHTNIVPIYSVHRFGPLHAFCMPYFGATTFATLLEQLRSRPAPPVDGSWLLDQLGSGPNRAARGLRELAGRGYVGAVLWLAARLADGLAYAHERGVVHRDLKPANVLLADDGEPMLLDFNLARDPALAQSIQGAYIGGTLPYMSPERIAAFAESRQYTDPRDDVYALGLILYELLTGRPPVAVPKGDVEGVVAQLTEARRHPVPDPRKLNRAVSPAVAAILDRCLAPELAHRYQSARDLAEDLTRHLTNRPLVHAPNTSLAERFTKWRRRNPRVASAYTAVALAVVSLGAAFGVVIWQERALARTESLNNLHEFRSELSASRLLIRAPAPTRQDVEQGMAVAERAAGRYELRDRTEPDDIMRTVHLDAGAKDALREDLAELALLRSRGEEFRAHLTADGPDRLERFAAALRLNELAQRFTRDTEQVNLIRRHRADLLLALGRLDEARTLRAETPAPAPVTPKNLRTLATERMAQGEFAAAADLLKRANRTDPQNPLGLMLLGYCYERLRMFPRAVGCYDAVLALSPNSHATYYRRAAAHAESGEHAEAIEDFSAALRLQPDYMPAHLDRALSEAALGDFRAAIADLDRALELPDAPTRIYFLRARYRTALGDRTAAAADRKEGLAREPNDEQSWVARGVARLPSEPKGALADFDRALQLNPRSLEALQSRASVLSEFLDRPKDAIEALDAALKVDPKYVNALIGRAVLRARAGNRTEAHRDARAALELSQAPVVQYQAACVYALTSKARETDRSEAIELLEAALRGGFGRAELAGDGDLDPLRNAREFQELVKKYAPPARVNRN
jgi:serine/threonine protein kinase/Flp pilus assembly protein TadD